MFGDARQIDHVLARAAAGEADIGLARFAGAVADAAQHRKRHRRADMLEPLLKLFDRADHVEALPCAAWAGADPHPAIAAHERLQSLKSDPHLFILPGPKRDTDGVDDPHRSEARPFNNDRLNTFNYL